MYDVILGRYLLNALELGLKFSIKIIIGAEGPYEGCSAPTTGFGNYDFNYLTEK